MKPEGKVFDRVWRNACRVERVNRRTVDNMIMAHYIGKWPASCHLTLGLRKGSRWLGVATFSVPHRPLLERFGSNTWELTRLWVHDDVPPNGETFLIGRAIRYIRKQHGDIRVLISFADPEAGHSGVIYKASNWSPEEHESKNLFTYRL